jgi:hypothetical protein
MKRPTTVVPALLLTGCAVTKDLTAASQPSDEATGASGTTSAETAVTTSDDTATTAEAAAAGTTAAELLADNLTPVRSSLDYDEDSVVDVALTGDGATSDGEGVSIDASVVTITAPGIHRLTGTLSDGQVVVDSPDDGLVQLILAGADLSSSTTSPLVVTDADEHRRPLDRGRRDPAGHRQQRRRDRQQGRPGHRRGHHHVDRGRRRDPGQGLPGHRRRVGQRRRRWRRAEVRQRRGRHRGLRGGARRHRGHHGR